MVRSFTNGKLSNGEKVEYAFALRNGSYRGAKTVHHGGALGGYRAQLLRFPEQNFSVIILSNLRSLNPSSFAYKIADIYLDKHLGSVESDTEQTIEPTEPTETLTLTKKQLEEFAGDYYSDELQVIYKALIEDSQLFVQINNTPKIAMDILDKDAFTGNFRIFFQRDENDKITGFTLDAGRVKNLKFLRK